jgi:osmotically-inducible protein OsmY
MSGEPNDGGQESQVRRDLERHEVAAEDGTPMGRFAEPRSWWERTRDEVTAWFGDRGALRRRQWDEAAGDHSGQGPRPTLDGDQRILDDVSRKLTTDPTLDASRIDVAVLAGRVTLTGAVLTRADKHLAEDLADGVVGVGQVQNKLSVG